MFERRSEEPVRKDMKHPYTCVTYVLLYCDEAICLKVFAKLNQISLAWHLSLHKKATMYDYM